MPQPDTSPIPSYGDFQNAVAIGKVDLWERFGKFGFVEDIDTGTDPMDIIGGGGLYAGQPADETPEIIEILHPNGADNSGSTGMRTVRIVGLRSTTSTEYTSEDITLTGTATDSANTWWRIVSVRGLTYGTGGTNAGTITARSKVTTAEIFAVIQVGIGRSQVAVFTAPAGPTITTIRDLQLTLTRLNGADGSAICYVNVRANGTGGYSAVNNLNISTGHSYNAYDKTPLVLNPLDDLIIRIQEVSDSNSSASATFDVFLYDDA